MIRHIDNKAWHHKRMRAEKRFQWYGRGALSLAVVVLVLLIGSLVSTGYQGFVQTQVRIDIAFDPQILGTRDAGHIQKIRVSTYQRAAHIALKHMFPEVTEHAQRRALYELISINSGPAIRKILRGDHSLLGKTVQVWVPASSTIDMFKKGKIKASTPELERKISDQQIAWLERLETQDAVRMVFNQTFFTNGNSRLPERAGFLGAIIGSAFTLLICLTVVFPLGVMAAIYLEEFARKSRWVAVIEVNINNLAAVPSIVFGLLGLAVYINVMHIPRSSALVGGMTLAMMILPVVIIATRSSLKSIPNSIRDAARGLGASPVQVVWHHVLPLAMPGIMTGTILGMARAIGETAPLLMIGMVAFVADLPTGVTSPAAVMPVQIYLWASSPEMGFAEKTSAGILVLLVLLLAMNALAIYLRKRFETRW
jgi:phosphate transport system permease protein